MPTTKTPKKTKKITTPVRVGGKLSVKSGAPALPSGAKAKAAPPPNAPPVPPDFKPLTREASGKLKREVPVQLASLEGAAAEAEGSTTWVEDFSKNAPSANAVASALLDAEAATLRAQGAIEFAEYVSVLKQLAWNALLELMEGTFGTEWDYAVKHDPTIVKRYPAIAQFMAARSALAKQGATRRKKKGKAEKASASAPKT